MRSNKRHFIEEGSSQYFIETADVIMETKGRTRCPLQNPYIAGVINKADDVVRK